jgi:hypothetical protein
MSTSRTLKITLMRISMFQYDINVYCSSEISSRDLEEVLVELRNEASRAEDLGGELLDEVVTASLRNGYSIQQTTNTTSLNIPDKDKVCVQHKFSVLVRDQIANYELFRVQIQALATLYAAKYGSKDSGLDIFEILD